MKIPLNYQDMLHVKMFEFSPIHENTYLLYDDSQNCCIVDPGCYFSNEREELKDFMKLHQLHPKVLLNTHCHLDHVFGNKFVHSTWKLEPHLHPLEKPMLEAAPAADLRWNMPFENYTGPLHFLEEGDEITIGSDQLKVLLTPGHSPGHLCFYCEKQQFMIGGDVLFRHSIGRTDLPGGNHMQLLKSIREKLFVLPDAVKVYPGHGEPTTIGHEKKHNPFFT